MHLGWIVLLVHTVHLGQTGTSYIYGVLDRCTLVLHVCVICTVCVPEQNFFLSRETL